MRGLKYTIKPHKSYYLTMTVVEWIDLFTRLNMKRVMTESLNYCIENKGLNVFGWCLMSNHLHLMANTDSKIELSDVIRDFKKFTSKRLTEKIVSEPESRRKWLLDNFAFNARIHPKNKIYKVWQDGNHAIDIYSEKVAWQKLNHIHQNPVRAEIVAKPEDYLFSSARDYHGLESLVKVNCLAPRLITVESKDFFRT